MATQENKQGPLFYCLAFLNFKLVYEQFFFPSKNITDLELIKLALSY